MLGSTFAHQGKNPITWTQCEPEITVGNMKQAQQGPRQSVESGNIGLYLKQRIVYPENIPRHHRERYVFMASQSVCRNPEETVIPWAFKLIIFIQLAACKAIETKEKVYQKWHKPLSQMYWLYWMVAHVVQCPFTKYRWRASK